MYRTVYIPLTRYNEQNSIVAAVKFNSEIINLIIFESASTDKNLEISQRFCSKTDDKNLKADAFLFPIVTQIPSRNLYAGEINSPVP